MNIAMFVDEATAVNSPLMSIPRRHRCGVLAAGHYESTASYPLWTLDRATVKRLADDCLLQPAGAGRVRADPPRQRTADA